MIVSKRQRDNEGTAQHYMVGRPPDVRALIETLNGVSYSVGIKPWFGDHVKSKKSRPKKPGNPVYYFSGRKANDGLAARPSSPAIRVKHLGVGSRCKNYYAKRNRVKTKDAGEMASSKGATKGQTTNNWHRKGVLEMGISKGLPGTPERY